MHRPRSKTLCQPFPIYPKKRTSFVRLRWAGSLTGHRDLPVDGIAALPARAVPRAIGLPPFQIGFSFCHPDTVLTRTEVGKQQCAVNDAARPGRTMMSSITADGMAAPAANPAAEQIGPLEQQHLQYANYRAVTDGTEVSKTHWHIAVANGARLGLRRHGRRDLRAGLAAGHQGLRADRPGISVRPADRAVCRHRRHVLLAVAGRSATAGARLLAVNIALFSLLMPVRGAVARPWPRSSRVRSRRQLRAERRMVARLDAGGGNLARAAARPRHRHQPRRPGASAPRSPAAIADLDRRRFRLAHRRDGAGAWSRCIAIYVRANCPESPYWVRAAGPQAPHRRDTGPAAAAVSDDDRDVGRQGPSDPARASCSCRTCCRQHRRRARSSPAARTTIYGTVGGWMPLYLAQRAPLVDRRRTARSTSGWGMVGFLGLLRRGLDRRPASAADRPST